MSFNSRQADLQPDRRALGRFAPGQFVPTTGLPDFSWRMIPKLEKCTKRIQNVPNGQKISQFSIKYINIFQAKALQILPKLGFLV
jgi:hypothetical protein